MQALSTRGLAISQELQTDWQCRQINRLERTRTPLHSTRVCYDSNSSQHWKNYIKILPSSLIEF